MAMLHTWGQTLTQHIHLHCIMPGGALSDDGNQWRSTAPDFLFPITSLSAQFRDAFCSGLQALYDRGQLTFAGQSEYLAERTAGSSGIHGVDTKCRGGSRTAPTRYADYPAKSQRPELLFNNCWPNLRQKSGKCMPNRRLATRRKQLIIWGGM